MFRLVGIITGAALAIAFLIIALGVPEFAKPEAAVVRDTVFEPALQPEPQPEPPRAPEMETAAAVAAVPESQAESTEKVITEPDYEALVEQIFTPNPEPVPESAADEKWYAFWSPFRSELAANGFVSKLQESTGIDYRVVKVKTGIYEVAFAYTDDEDIQEKLSRISAATGLDMSDS